MKCLVDGADDNLLWSFKVLYRDHCENCSMEVIAVTINFSIHFKFLQLYENSGGWQNLKGEGEKKYNKLFLRFVMWFCTQM